jgi:hypothetical protein
MKNFTHNRRLIILRILLLAFGSIIIVLAFLADRLGFGDAGSFGIGQFLLALVGFSVLLMGLLGRRFVNLYRDTAIIFLNTLILLALVELTAIVIGRTSFQVKHTGIQDLPYYAAQDWTEAYWQEASPSMGYHYEPYVVWQHLPFSGEMINNDQLGMRRTPGADCVAGAYKVFTFGGSTMLGWGAPDWGTIPAYLQKYFEEFIERPVCVVNMAQDGYVSTQSMIALTLQLQSGNIPDLVIFYDGVNEVLAAYESGRPSVHVTLSRIAARFEERNNPLVTWVQGTRTYALIERLFDKPEQEGSGLRSGKLQDSEWVLDNAGSRQLGDMVSDVYLVNYEIVEALSKGYDFDFFFFLQPHMAVGEKVLTIEEQMMISRMDPILVDLAREFYGNVILVEDSYDNFWNLTHVLDEEETQIYFDEVSHITPVGNRLVAQEIITIIQQKLFDE